MRPGPLDVFEKTPAGLFGRSTPLGPQARVEAELDRGELAAALGCVAPPSTPPATGVEAPVGLGRIGGPDAGAVLRGPLASLTEKARWLEARARQVKDALSATDTRDARTAAGFRVAGGFLDKAARDAGAARQLSRLVPGDLRASLERMTAARQRFVDVQRQAGEAETTLLDMAAHAREMPRALQDVREIQRVAGEARWVTSRTESRGEMLAAASENTATPGAAPALGELDLASIGSALDPGQPPPQTSWSEHMINTVCELGRQQGGVTDEQGARNFELAKAALSADGSTGPRELGAADLAELLQKSGVDLTRVDPNQLQAASRYVSGATSLDDQQQRLRKTLDSFQVLAAIGLPRLTRQQMVDELWVVARVPGHALTKLGDSEVAKKLQEVLATVNAGPGKSEIKIGKYNLKLEVGAGGAVESSSCKKPGFFSRVWSGIKKVAPIALTVASFIPVTAPFARAAQGVLSLVKAVQAKSLIGFATAGAAIVGAGAAIARGASTVVGTVERVANSVAHGLQGVSSVRQGNVLGGLASLGSAVAGGIGQAAGRAANGLERFGKRLGQVSGRLQSVAQGVSAVQGYQAADRAVRAANQALAQAQASGDLQAIARAQRQLAEAERGKKAALLGGLGTAAMIGADKVGGWGAPGPGESFDRGPAASGLEASLRAAGRAFSGAGNVVQKDWEALGASAIGFAAAARSAVRPESSVSQDPIRRRVDELLGKGPQVSTLNEASNLADAAVSQRQASRAETEANQAVKAAEAALDAAETSGDAEAILAARANLARVRKSREGALMGAIGASDALLQTAAGIGREREAARAFGAARDGVVRALDSAERTAEDAAALGRDLPPDLREDVRELAGKLTGARTRYEQRLQAAQGDPQRIEQATWGFLSEQMKVWAGLSLVEQEAVERQKPRIILASATAQVGPVDPREGARVQIEMGRAQVKDALDEQMRLRMTVGAASGAPMPETAIETAAQGYAAALDRLQALNDGGASNVDLRKAQMEVNLARTLFDAARNPHRTASDPPPWAVGLGTFVEEFGKGALAIVSFGGTAAMEQAYKTGRLDARSGIADGLQIYLEGIFNGITFGGADAFADARAGQGRGLLGSSAAALAASLRNVSGYDDVKTIFTDPHANAYDKAQAMATLVAKWAGLAAAGIAGARYARRWSETGPGAVEGSSTIPPRSGGKGPPYDPSEVAASLESEYPGRVSSSTIPPRGSKNVGLAGTRHASAVVFDQRGFPIFDDVAAFDTKLPSSVATVKSRPLHFQEAARALSDAIRRNEIPASRFTTEQLRAIHSYQKKIPGLTWHHHQQPGRIQLIPTPIHQAVGHTGGFALWFEK